MANHNFIYHFNYTLKLISTIACITSQVGDTWTNPADPCTTVSCLEDPNISTQTILKEKVQMCPKCAEGEKEVMPDGTFLHLDH